MKIAVELSETAAASLVEAVVAAMRAEGLAVLAEGRTKPYSVPELVEETGQSASSVRRLIEAGVFERVPYTGRALVTVASVRRWQAGQRTVPKAKGGRA